MWMLAAVLRREPRRSSRVGRASGVERPAMALHYTTSLDVGSPARPVLENWNAGSARNEEAVYQANQERSLPRRASIPPLEGLSRRLDDTPSIDWLGGNS